MELSYTAHFLTDANIHAPKSKRSIVCSLVSLDLGVTIIIYLISAIYSFSAAMNSVEVFCGGREPNVISDLSLGSVSFITVAFIVLGGYFALKRRLKYRRPR